MHTLASIPELVYTQDKTRCIREEVMPVQEQINQFLSAAAFGVAGASANRQKYGNRVLRCYLQNGKRAVPVNPNETEIEGIACVASVDGLPAEVKSLSMITPPAVTELLVPKAIAHGIENIWMQPGAESPAAVALCREKGVNVIADGSCLLVVLGYHDH
jgi:predicted CoA-binding protein